jgi:hypothetical protein
MPEIGGSATPAVTRLFARLSAMLLKHLESAALNGLFAARLVRMHSFALVLRCARRLSPASHLSPALVIDLHGGAALRSPCACRALWVAGIPATMSMAQGQWSRTPPQG